MMRKGLRFLFLLVVALAFVPGKAYAWDFLPDGQMWAGDVGGNHCATVHAGEIYDAATYAVGSDPNKVSSSVRVKLSDPSYGGRFYEYAQTFSKMESWDDFPEWLPAYVGVAQLIANGLIGDFNIYNSEASASLFEGAMIDFKRVLAGEDLSGGGSGGGSGGSVVPVGEYYSIPLVAVSDNEPASSANKEAYRFSAQNATYEDGTLVLTSGTTKYSPWINNSAFVADGVLYASDSLLQLANVYLNQGYDVVLFNGGPFCGMLYGSNLVITYGRYTTHNNFQSYYVAGSDLHSFSFDCTSYFNVDDGVFCFVPSFSDSPSSRSESSPWRTTYISSVYSEPFNSPPSGTWPEPTPPVTPDPPEIPTPTAPTETVDPDPTAPTITWPTSPTLVLPTSPIVSTTPEGIDYTALLTLINDNLNSIDAYLQNFYTSFNSFRSDFLSGVDDIVDGLRNIYQYLGHLNNILEVHCKHITDQIEESVYNLELYIKRLFEWLPKQLNFDAKFDYDDSAVTTLLRRILNKIPGGSTGTPVSYKPNPQSDEPGFFDWLADLWHRFLLDLVSVLPDALGGLVDDISQLTHYFPFSIPWDMFALLALFAHEPVTPVFDVPWGYGGDEGEIQMIRVDLSAWDGVMETVRPVFLVGFCMQLAMITKDLLANFDLKQGGV